jgi:adenylate kinase
MNIVFLGPPGAGKGTQAKMICDEYNLIQLSTGELLRKSLVIGTELGIKAAEYWENGQLVPDDIMIHIFAEEIRKPISVSGYILDGFPRTIPQAYALEDIFAELNMKLDTVLVLKVPQDILVKRLAARRVCPDCGASYHLEFKPPKSAGFCDFDGAALYQRGDDNEEVIRNRLVVYDNLTSPLITHYNEKSMTTMINGLQNIDKVLRDIKPILDKFKTNKI